MRQADALTRRLNRRAIRLALKAPEHQRLRVLVALAEISSRVAIRLLLRHQRRYYE